MKKTIAILMLLGQIFHVEGMKNPEEIWNHERIQNVLTNFYASGREVPTEEEVEAYNMLYQLRAQQVPDVLYKMSCTKQGNEKYEQDLVNHLNLDPEITEIRYVNAESYQLPEELSNLLKSNAPLTELFAKRCTFENDEIKKEVLGLIDEGCKQSKIFYDVMVCYLAILASDFYYSTGNKTFSRSTSEHSRCFREDGTIQLRKEDSGYMLSAFGRTLLNDLNIYLVLLSKLYILFHECGHGISTFFNELPYTSFDLKTGSDILSNMDEESQWYWNLIANFVPTSANEKKIAEILDLVNFGKFSGKLGEIEKALRDSLDRLAYGNTRVTTIQRDEDGNLSAEETHIVNDLGDHVKINTIPFIKMSDGSLDDGEFDEGCLWNGQERYICRDKNGDIIGEKVMSKDGVESFIYYKNGALSVKLDHDKLRAARDEWISRVKNKFSQPSFRTQMLFNGPAEVWQILGIAPVKQRDGKVILYINELSDFALYTSLGIPFRSDHQGSYSIEKLLFGISPFTYNEKIENLFDSLFHLHGTSLEEYRSKLDAWLNSHPEQKNIAH